MSAYTITAREADNWPGVNLDDQSSPEAKWLAATVLQCNSPAPQTNKNDTQAVTPSSTSRQLFSPSHAPTKSPDAQKIPAAANIEQEINRKKAEIAAAATAAAQELAALEQQLTNMSPNNSPTKDAAALQQNTTTQEPVQTDPTHPNPAAVLQLNSDAQEPAHPQPQHPVPQEPVVYKATTAASNQPKSLFKPMERGPNHVAMNHQTANGNDCTLRAQANPLPQPMASLAKSLEFLRPGKSNHCEIETILQEAVARFRIEEDLLSTRMGISGLSDLYKVTADRHEDLKALLADPDATGNTLRRAFADFFFSFQGIKGCSKYTAAAATLLHASLVSDGFNLQIRQCLKAGIGLSDRDKDLMAHNASMTGKLTHRDASYGDLENLQENEWVGLLSIAVEYLCFDPNKEKSFERERRALCGAKLTNFNKSSEALAHIRTLHQAATTAFGSDFMTYYDLFKLTKDKLSKEIQFEINEITATGKAADALDCDWKYIEDIVTTAWRTFSRRPTGYYSKVASIGHADTPKQAEQSEEFTAHNASLEADQFKEKVLKCQRSNEDGTTCSKEFTWTTAQQMHHNRMGWTTTPKSCPAHREKSIYPATNQDDREEKKITVCQLFRSSGRCSYGDKCKFSHATHSNHVSIKDNPRPQLAIEHPSIDSDDDNYTAWHIRTVPVPISDSDDDEFIW